MTFTPSLRWNPNFGKTVVGMAITESAGESATVDARSNEVLGVSKSKHIHGRHFSNWGPFTDARLKPWASEMTLNILR